MTAAPGTRSNWYRQSLLWLGALILVAVVAGCIQLIVVATRHADKPVATAQPLLFGMPTARPVTSEHARDLPGKTAP